VNLLPKPPSDPFCYLITPASFLTLVQSQAQSPGQGQGQDASPPRSTSLDRTAGAAAVQNSTGQPSTHIGTAGGSTTVAPSQAAPIPALTPTQLAAAEEAERWLSSLLLGGKVGVL
jgi:hypothetical protein